MKIIYFSLLALLISFYSFALPSIAGPGSVCVVSTITLTDATSGGAWSSSNTAVATVGSVSGVVIGVTAGSVTITYTVGASNVTASVLVNPLPSLYTVIGGGSYCAGGSGVHVGLNFSTPGISYQLFRGGTSIGVPVAGSGSGLDFGLETGAGIYTVVATNPITGCSVTMSGSGTITINPLPTIFALTGGGVYCSGGAGVHIGLAGSQTGIMYQLYSGVSPVGSTFTGTGLPIDFGVHTAGTYTVIATDPVTGCTAIMTGTITITIVPLPAVHALTGGGTFCAGIGGHLTLAGSDTGVNYTLDSAGIAIMTLPGTGGPLDFGYHMGGSFTIVAVSTAGCTTLMSGPVTITITPTVTPSVTISTGVGDTVCAGTMVIFTAIGVNGGATPTYNWTVNGVSAGSGVVHTYTPSNGDVVNVCLVSSAACASPGTVCHSLTMTVLPTVVPSVTITASPGTYVPFGTTVTYTAVGVNGGSAPTYAWDVNGVAAGTGLTYSYVPITGDTTNLCMTSNATCASPVIACNSIEIHIYGIGKVNELSAKEPVNLYPNPVDNDLTIVADATIYNTYTVTNNIGQVVIHWALSGNKTTVDVSTLPSGMYFIALTGTNNCTVRKFVKM